MIRPNGAATREAYACSRGPARAYIREGRFAASSARLRQSIGPVWNRVFSFGMAAVAGVAALDVANAAALSARDRRRASARHDYSDRSGFPRAAAQMRGAALSDFRTPPDLRAELPRAPRPQTELQL